MPAVEGYDPTRILRKFQRWDLLMLPFGPVMISVLTIFVTVWITIGIYAGYELQYKRYLHDASQIFVFLAIFFGLFVGMIYQSSLNRYRARLVKQAEAAGLIEKLAMSPDWPPVSVSIPHRMIGKLVKRTTVDSLSNRLERLALNLDSIVNGKLRENATLLMISISLPLALFGSAAKLFSIEVLKSGQVANLLNFASLFTGSSKAATVILVARYLLLWIAVAGLCDLIGRKRISMQIVRKMIYLRLRK